MKIFFIFLFVYTSFSKLSFSPSKCQVESNRQWSRVKIAVDGGDGTEKCTFTEIPKNWKQVKDFLYIPRKDLLKKTKYPCRVIIESQKEELKGTVLFVSGKKKIRVAETTFSYNHVFKEEFFEERGFSGKPKFRRIENLNKKIQNLRSRRKSFFRKMNKLLKLKFKKRTVEESNKLVETAGSGLDKIIEEIVPTPQRITPISQKNIQQTVVNKEIKKLQELVHVQPQPTQQISQKRSIQSIFTRFPTPEEQDQFIAKADIYLIVKTIQEVVQHDELTCLQKISYLSEFRGRIKTAFQVKSFTLNELTVITKAAQTEIRRLRKEIDYLNSQIQSFGIEDLRDELDAQLDKLQLAYSNFNEVDSKIQPKELVIGALSTEIEVKKEQGDKKRQAIVQKKLLVTEVNSEINKLESQLRNARERKAFIEGQIRVLQNDVKQIQNKINNLQIEIKKLEEEIASLSARSDELKIAYTILEISAERLRTSLSKSITKKESHQKNIEDYEADLQLEEKKLATQQIERLINITKTLKESEPNIQEKIDKLSYECYKVAEVEEKKEDNTVVYILNAKSLQKYIQSVYSFSDTSSLTSTTNIKVISILDRKWEEAYGIPYSDRQLASTKSFRIESEFNCLNPSTLRNGKGTIRAIKNSEIEVEDKNRTRIKLKLGACTRIQAGNGLPRLGQKIYWKGNERQDRKYEVYSALCL